jgi:hypothetical protein
VYLNVSAKQMVSAEIVHQVLGEVHDGLVRVQLLGQSFQPDGHAAAEVGV